MSDTELLLAISNILDKKLHAGLEPVDNRLKYIETALENNVIPRLQNIESCYMSTYERYKNSADGNEAMEADVSLLKEVVAEHSARLQQLA